ncbi:MAG: monovalent cation/H+ antiporter complex subunit F [Longimicrobiales bacterium]
MTTLLLAVGLVLLLSLVAGLARLLAGPSPGDRVIAVQLFGTAGVAFLLILAEVGSAPPLRDVALVFALLAAVIVTAFVKRGWVRQRGRDGDD